VWLLLAIAIVKGACMIRLLIVAPNRLECDLLRAVCRTEPDFRVIGTLSDTAQAAPYRERCDVVLVSHGSEPAHVTDLIRAMRGATPGPSLVVTGLPDEPQLLEYYREAGASGCIHIHDSSAELVRALRLAAQSQTRVPADKNLSVPVKSARISDGLTEGVRSNGRSLTNREREILELIARGYGSREIAQELTIQLGTAKNHVHNILDKLSVKTRRDAALYYSLDLI
jgi:DNA-binding NarL/FixJ family response regulator